MSPYRTHIPAPARARKRPRGSIFVHRSVHDFRVVMSRQDLRQAMYRRILLRREGKSVVLVQDEIRRSLVSLMLALDSLWRTRQTWVLAPSV